MSMQTVSDPYDAAGLPQPSSGPARPITVSDVDEMREQVRDLRNRVNGLFNDSRLTHAQSAATAATVDALNSVLSASYVLKLLTS